REAGPRGRRAGAGAGAGRRLRRRPRNLAHAIFRTLIVPQTEKSGMPDTPIARPLSKANLGHEPGLDPVVAASGRRAAHEGRGRARQRPELLADAREGLFVEARAHLRDVDELAILVKTEVEGAEMSARALRHSA